jgi:hypothetical protein
VYGKRQPVTTGLTWGYYGGRWGGFSVADGTLTLDPVAVTERLVMSLKKSVFSMDEQLAGRQDVERAMMQVAEEAAAPATQVTFEDAKSAITRNESPDMGFTLGLNPYRGCEHGCVYCYARPTHSYLNLSPGLDFETRLVAKPNLPQVLARELQAASYLPRQIVIGS